MSSGGFGVGSARFDLLKIDRPAGLVLQMAELTELSCCHRLVAPSKHCRASGSLKAKVDEAWVWIRRRYAASRCSVLRHPDIGGG